MQKNRQDRKKRVLLISPPFIVINQHRHAPLGLYYIANYICDIADVEVYDCNVEKYSEWSDINSVLDKHSPDIIGFSILTPTVIEAIKMLHEVKQNNSQYFCIAGGMHASIYPDDMLNAGFDMVIRGEGEITFRNIVEKFGFSEMYDTDGISFKKDGVIYHNTDREEIQDLDSIGFPRLTKKQLGLYEYASIITSRGCGYGCYYCASSKYWKQTVRRRSVESILAEIEYYLDLGTKHIYFCDDDFFGSYSMVKELLKSIVEKGMRFTWNALVRVDLITEELMVLAKESGCVCLSVGVECGSEAVLWHRKKIKANEIIDKFNIIKRHDICTRTTWMIGMGRSYEEEKESVNLMKTLLPNQISVHMLIPYPGTEAWDNAEAYNILLDKENIDYSILNTTYSPTLIDYIKYKHLSKEAIIALVDYFKREMKKLGYTDVNDEQMNEYRVIETFMDAKKIPMIL